MNFIKCIGDWIVAFFALAFGLACLFITVYAFYSTLFSAFWTETDGRVTKSYITQGSKNKLYTPHVNYTYQVNGSTYEGGVLSYDGSFLRSFDSKETVEKKLLPYQKDAVIKIYYNPLYPAQSCIERGGGLTLQFITLLLGIGLIFFGISEIRDLLKISVSSPNPLK